MRFLHTKTALCDRKDTQSRFAVNAARSIVCVETRFVKQIYQSVAQFQCRTQHCVCRDLTAPHRRVIFEVSMPHAALCVSRLQMTFRLIISQRVSMPHAALCVSRPPYHQKLAKAFGGFNAARSIVCVET